MANFRIVVRQGATVRAAACWSALAVAVTAAAAAAPPGAAAASDPVVARAGGVQLTIGAGDDDELCLSLGALRTRGSARGCGDPASGIAVVDTGDARPVVGVALPGPVSRVVVRRAGRELASAPASASGTRTDPRAAGLVYALISLPAGAPTTGLRMAGLDAAGAPVRTISGGDATLVTARRAVLAGRAAGGIRWSLTARLESELAPSVVDPDREAVSRCVGVTLRTTRGSSTTSGCAGGEPFATVLESLPPFGTTDRCRPRFRLVSGVLPRPVTGVGVVLGDGRSIRARIAAIDPTHVAYALVVGAGAAIRAVRITRGGERTRTLRSGLAPLEVACAATVGDEPVPSLADVLGSSDRLLNPFGSIPPVTPAGPVTTLAGPPRVRVADGPAGTLCLAVGNGPFTPLGCRVVPPLPDDLAGTFGDFRHPRAFVVAVPAEVATVRVSGPRGRGTRDIPTVVPTGYGGRYAGRIRLAAAHLASLSALSAVTLLDAAGRVLYSDAEDAGSTSLTPRVGPSRRIAGSAGRPSLWRTPITGDGSVSECLLVTAGGRPPAGPRCAALRVGHEPVAILSASCATHRLTVAVLVDAGEQVRAGVAGGRTLAVPLRAGAGLVTLRPTDALRSIGVVRHGARTVSVAVTAPPAAAQCGYVATPTFLQLAG